MLTPADLWKLTYLVVKYCNVQVEMDDFDATENDWETCGGVTSSALLEPSDVLTQGTDAMLCCISTQCMNNIS